MAQNHRKRTLRVLSASSVLVTRQVHQSTGSPRFRSVHSRMAETSVQNLDSNFTRLGRRNLDVLDDDRFVRTPAYARFALDWLLINR
jgi:hypothetical protein